MKQVWRGISKIFGLISIVFSLQQAELAQDRSAKDRTKKFFLLSF